MAEHAQSDRTSRKGRPPLSADEKLTEVVRLRLTAAELELVRRRSAAAGITVSDYLRRRVQNSPIPRHRFNPALVSEINELGLQLRAVGNLANQLARSVHTGRKFVTDWRVVRDAVDQTVQKASDALEQVTAGDGSQDS